MAAPRNTFTDPNSVLATYAWQVNHSEEEDFGKQRNVQHSANTANTGLIRQQSDDSPMVLRFSGTILHKAQLQKMIDWWKLCETQTIHFEDFTGDKYEVLITSFQPKRVRTIKNPRDYANAPYWIWKYEIEMEVVSFLTPNLWSAVTP